jgi:hypothetical protein
MVGYGSWERKADQALPESRAGGRTWRWLDMGQISSRRGATGRASDTGQQTWRQLEGSQSHSDALCFRLNPRFARWAPTGG